MTFKNKKTSVKPFDGLPKRLKNGYYVLSVSYDGYDPDMDIKIEKALKQSCSGSGYGGRRDMTFTFTNLSKLKLAIKAASKFRGLKIDAANVYWDHPEWTQSNSLYDIDYKYAYASIKYK